VTVTCAGQQVARHRRSWARHRTVTAVEHGRARAELRQAARDIAAARPGEVEVEVRD
jgi:hypothetical protein